MSFGSVIMSPDWDFTAEILANFHCCVILQLKGGLVYSLENNNSAWIFESGILPWISDLTAMILLSVLSEKQR